MNEVEDVGALFKHEYDISSKIDASNRLMSNRDNSHPSTSSFYSPPPTLRPFIA